MYMKHVTQPYMVYASTVLVCIVSWYDAPYMENVRHPRPRGVSRDTRTYFSTCAPHGRGPRLAPRLHGAQGENRAAALT